MKSGVHILGFNICAYTEQRRNNIRIFSIRSSKEQRGFPFPAIIYHIETISEPKRIVQQQTYSSVASTSAPWSSRTWTTSNVLQARCNGVRCNLWSVRKWLKQSPTQHQQSPQKYWWTYASFAWMSALASSNALNTSTLFPNAAEWSGVPLCL